jgi:hypothetical protein
MARTLSLLLASTFYGVERAESHIPNKSGHFVVSLNSVSAATEPPGQSIRAGCPARLLRSVANNDGGNVISTPRFIREGHQPICSFLGVPCIVQDPGYFTIREFARQSIGAQQYGIVLHKELVTNIYFDSRFNTYGPGKQVVQVTGAGFMLAGSLLTQLSKE